MTGVVLYASASHLIGGGNRSLLTICERLQQEGSHPHVVVPAHGPMTEALAAQGVPFDVIGRKPGIEPSRLDLLADIWRWWRLAKRLRATLLHANHIGSLPVLNRVGKLLGVPVVGHVRYYTEPDAARYYLKSAPSALVFNSREMQEVFPDYPARGTTREMVLYNGFDPDAYAAPELRQPVRDEWGCDSRRVVGILGNFAQVKGHECFLQMAATLCRHADDWHFVVIGDDILEGGARRDALIALADDMGLSDRVTFAGFERNVARALSGLDLLMVPSTREPFGRVAVEGLLAGLPVVASQVGGLPEILEGCPGAALVEADNVAGFVEAVERLLPVPPDTAVPGGDIRPRDRPHAANREWAAQRFGLDVVFAQLTRLYDDVCSPDRQH